MFAAINIDLDQKIFPGHLVAQLVQPSSNCRWPERGELFRAELDFAFFALCAAAHLESQ